MDEIIIFEQALLRNLLPLANENIPIEYIDINKPSGSTLPGNNAGKAIGNIAVPIIPTMSKSTDALQGKGYAEK